MIDHTRARQANWADVYPTEGDVIVAQHHLEHRDDPARASTAYQVVLAATGTVIGGIGSKDHPTPAAPLRWVTASLPSTGAAATPPRRHTLLLAAADDPQIQTVLAETELYNHASHRAAEKAGMRLARTHDGCRYYEWRPHKRMA